MPVWTEQQLDAAIAANEIGVITLDTSIFDKFGCNLSYRALRRLDQFKGSGVAVVFPTSSPAKSEHILRRKRATRRPTSGLRSTNFAKPGIAPKRDRLWHRRST